MKKDLLCSLCHINIRHRKSWCKSCWSKKTREYYLANRDDFIRRVKEWRIKNLNRDKENQKRFKIKNKAQAMAVYGKGKIACECCGINNLEFLTIDHVNKNGSKFSKSIRSGLYNWLKQNNYPDLDSYRILCWNCNRTSFYEICPHQLLNTIQTS